MNIPSILSISLLGILASCAIQPVKLAIQSAETYQIPLNKIIIDNLAIDRKIDANESLYVNGWAELGAPTFSPSISQALTAKLKTGLQATGDTGRAEISILRTGFFVEKTVADDVVFVGFLTLGKERGYKCDADINIKTTDNSERYTFTHEIRRTYFDDKEQIRQFMNACLDDLVNQVSNKFNSSI